MSRTWLLAQAVCTSTALVCIRSIRLEAAVLCFKEIDSKSNSRRESEFAARARCSLESNLDCQDAFGGHPGHGRRVAFKEGVDGVLVGWPLFKRS
jgi:hypothetical protein